MKNNNIENVKKIINLLEKEYKGTDIALVFSNPFELLTATILSAQCTDERVNKVTKNLFKRYKTINDYANANIKEVEEIIKSAGFFRTKAKNIVGCAQIIMKNHDGKVPQDMDKLIQLPGIGRKTANIVLGSAFKKYEGIAVDTHVIRIAKLLKLTKNSNPIKIEEDLMKIVPKENFRNFSFLIQTLGRKVCKARGAKHSDCVLKDICPSKK